MKQLQYLKETKYFQDLTVSTLQKMSYNMKKLNFKKGQTFYKEGQSIDGIYIILEGRVKYTKVVEYSTPCEATTVNKYFVKNVKRSSILHRKMPRDICSISNGGCFGFEEICRDFLVCHNENIKFSKSMLQYRDFTCAVDSLSAQVLQLNLEIVVPILQNMKIGTIKQIFMQRKHVLDKVLNTQF